LTEAVEVMADPRVVDSHHHLWDLGVRDQPWTVLLPSLRRTFDLAELRPQLEAAGVGRTVLVQTVHVAEETPEMLRLAAISPVVAGVVGWTDLTVDDVDERLAALRAAPGGEWLVGVRHGVQGEADPRWLQRPDVTRGLRAVGSVGLVYDLLVTTTQLPAVIETVRALPGVRFVLDHGGKPPIARGGLDPWRQHIDAIAAAENVAVKLSGLFTEAAPDWSVDDIRPFADHLLDRFGAERTMFGSDWPVSTLRATYGEVVAATRVLTGALSPGEQAAVFGGTATRWYDLDTGERC